MIKAELIDKGVSGALAYLKKQGQDVAPLLDTAGVALRNRIRSGFDTGRSPGGTPWRRLRHRSGQPLRDTGRLRNSIIKRRSGVDSVTVGTNVCYGKVHQFGAVVRATKQKGTTLCGQARKGAGFLAFKGAAGMIYAQKVVIPARPFMPLSGVPTEWSNEILRRLGKKIIGGIP